jgi:peptidoglycan/LPS O-acetylase OafA/YrhL
MIKESTPRADALAEPTSANVERDHLGRQERGVWRSALLLLGCLSVAFAVSSWQSVRSLPHYLEVLPVALVTLVALFVAYAWTKTSEIAELRGLVRGIEQRTEPGHDVDQLDQLF